MKNNLEKGKILIRITMAIVFLYFGISQLINPDEWAGLVPKALDGIIITANNIVILNGIIEVTLGIFLLIGLYTKISALLLAIHLGIITINLGLTPVGIRDFGLTIATLTIFLNGRDSYCIDNKFNKKTKHMQQNNLI